MKTAAAKSLFATLLVNTLIASANPILNYGGHGKDSNPSAGALYFINNDPSGNFVISHDIAKNGQVSFSRGTSAGGKGLHGNDAPSPIGPDGLFSQGSVVVSGHNLYTINPGSNTIVMFSIDPSNPSHITMVGHPVNTGGDFPVSLAVSPRTGEVCVLNGGQNNGIQCFRANSNGLSALPNTHRTIGVKQTTPPAGPANTVSDIIFSSDGSKLIVAVKGTPPSTQGFLATWDVNTHDFSLSSTFAKSFPGKGGLLAFSMTLIKGTDAILNTDAAVGFSVFDFGKAKNDVAPPSVVTAIAGQSATCWSTFSPRTGNYYLTDAGTSTVTEVTIDRQSLKASIVKQYPQKSGSATLDSDVASIGGNDYLYIMAAGATSIDVLSLNGPGKAQNHQQYDFASAAQKAGLKVDPNSLQGMATFVKGS